MAENRSNQAVGSLLDLFDDVAHESSIGTEQILSRVSRYIMGSQHLVHLEHAHRICLKSFGQGPDSKQASLLPLRPTTLVYAVP